ncbi:toxin HicA [Corynebacterium hansenii]|uniref:Toxin HicA n=1 Tax=Corynebacterium hansenii TaxID=394964 RepID=A0ABV7ZMX7_9CORY|nr:toxin HicA [Corynebacterium hansenii]
MIETPQAVEKRLRRIRRRPDSVSFDDLRIVCDHFFERRPGKGSHVAVYKMPWIGDPRINLQRGEGGNAKPYQVRQALKAIDRLLDEKQ